jgi:signal peptide peptidase SppA
VNLADVIRGPWCITDEAYATIREVYDRKLRGEKADLADIEARLGRPLDNQRSESFDLEDGIATIRLEGILAKRMNLFTAISGGTSTEIFRDQVARAKASPDVRGAILYIDSPGGTADGTQLAANEVLAFRDVKPIVTVAGGMIASAAYWIGSAATHVFLEDETTLAGSIGAKGQHIDRSQADAKEGIVRTELIAGRYKGVGSDTRPLSDDDRAILEARLADMYTVFVDAVARNLGRSPADVVATIAEGRVFLGRHAVDVGLAHGIATLAQVRQRMIAGEFNVRGPAKPVAQGEKNRMDIATLKAQHPDLFAQIDSEAFARGKQEGETAGRALGAKAELERILGVEAQALPGHEQLIATLKADGKTTGAEAAVQVLAAEKKKLGGKLEALTEDAKEPAKVQQTVPGQRTQDAPKGSIEEQCKHAWENDPKVQAEFTSLAAYTAFRKAEASGGLRLVSRAS